MKKYVGIIITSIFLIIGCIGLDYLEKKAQIIDNWCFSDEQIKEYGPFWITVPAAENKGLPADVNGIMFEDEPDIIYLVLPKTVNEKKVVYYVRDGYDSNFEARRVANFEDGNVEVAGKTIKLVDSSVPIMFLVTDEENMPFSEFRDTYDREAICSGKIYYEDIVNSENMYLKPRGNGTWAGMHKKPYTLVLENNENLCGNVNSKKWNLLADAYDKSLLKNYTFNKLAHELDIEYEPNAKHICLYINGNFEGVYLLTEKIDANSGSVNIGKADWLFIWGGTHPQQIISYESKCWFGDTDETGILFPYVELLYPKEDSAEGLNEKQIYIQQYIDAIEDETAKDYLKYLDIESFVRFYWIQEASMNKDACYRSIYTVYKASTDKLYYEPVWDMDLTLRNNYEKPRRDGGTIDFSSVTGWKTREMAYYRELFEHPEFEEVVKKAYFEGGVKEKLWNAVTTFEDEKEYLGELAELDFRIWKNEAPETVLADNYNEHTNIVINDYITRLKWIDEQIKK